jgi:hypothetical protein
MVQAARIAEILGRETPVQSGQAQRSRERGGPGASVAAERLSLYGRGAHSGKVGLANAGLPDAFGFDVGVVN